MVMDKGSKKVGILGFSFKAGTDDLRESPLVDVIEQLIGKGYELRLYDRNVNLAALTGANQDYILNMIPHISKLMMTSMAGALGMLPLAWGIGSGADMLKPMAIAVIGALLFSDMLSLVATPTVYYLLRRGE